MIENSKLTFGTSIVYDVETTVTNNLKSKCNEFLLKQQLDFTHS